MPRGGIPDRWEEYNPIGLRIEGTRFITFKVPLKRALVSALPKEQRFTPEILFKTIQEQNQQLGIILDLTNTFRYYNPNEIIQHNAQHVKIKTEGHVVPSRAVQKQFMDAVDYFLETNADNDILVGVHCTHGLNRTGYLVCRYMIDKLGMDPDTAISAYNQARGHDMERQNYLDDLRKPKVDGEEEDDEEAAAAANYGDHRRINEQHQQHQRQHQRPYQRQEGNRGSIVQNGAANWQDRGGNWQNGGGNWRNGGGNWQNGGGSGQDRGGNSQDRGGNWRDRGGHRHWNNTDGGARRHYNKYSLDRRGGGEPVMNEYQKAGWGVPAQNFAEDRFLREQWGGPSAYGAAPSQHRQSPSGKNHTRRKDARRQNGKPY